MAENINIADAEKVLLSAFRTRCTKQDAISLKIKEVIQGTHKTYKYILAKATNENINALALQAGADLTGAYDARTLCHKVLVPFERNFLENSLGGSNEPFLNKPARFTHLSNTNAVRRGNDKETLDKLIDIFNVIANAKEAKSYLSCALEYLNQRITELNKLNDSSINYSPTLVEIYEFVYRFLEKSFEGQTSAIIVGSLEKIYHRRFSKNFEVIAHKVNQSGSSSKEIGDIDIFKEGTFHYAIEVKDKNFNSHDVEHAFTKIIQSKGIKGQFIYGVNAFFDEKEVTERISRYEKKGFMVLFQDILTYSRTMIFKTDLDNKQEFIDTIIQTAIEINSKEEVKSWIQKLLLELNWK
jgi:hypothetical protein